MKKFLLFLILFCPLIGWSQATTGYHRISRVLARAPQSVTAQVVPYATVNVTVAATGLAATIYSDPLLSVLITPPVVTADLNGNYSYYIPLNYMVTETISSPGQGNSVVPNVGNISLPTAFSALTSGTNTSASLVIGTGGSLTTSGTGINDSTTVIIPETASTAGTTANLGVTYDGSTGNVVTMSLAGLGFLGIAQTTATSGNPVQVCYVGTCSCVADNTVTAGNLLGAGTATAGRCRDLGVQTSASILGNVAIWGKAQSGGGAGTVISFNATGPGHFGASINNSMSTTPLTITGATPIYSFDSQGVGGLAVCFVSGGACSSILTWGVVGSGYAVGDLITPGGGNSDAVIQITAVNGAGQPTAGTVLYGGTGYIATGGYTAETPTSSYAFTFLLSGVLTQNVTFIMTHGTYLTQSNQWIWANNTTGAFTTTVCVAGATDSCSGGRTVVIPQGTNNSASAFIQTDGVLNVDFADRAIDTLQVSGPLAASTLSSTVATGTPPLIVASTTPVTNLSIGGNAATATNVTGVVAVANGGTGDTGTQWSQTTPTPTCQTGTATTISSVVRVKTIGKTAFVSVLMTDTANGTCTGAISVSLPFTANSQTDIFCRENSISGVSGGGYIVAGTTSVMLTNYNNASYGVTGSVVGCSGVIETQ